ncbi:calcium homeostasis modulator protein 6-like [Notechis scutatus]|uniref:Calcium homeostasis modulator protein 6-like n=1 Tax=Notechis scutatus TaxID=8663 RepID=A0A6J1W0V3_9SAUR|nr:calcium homeostasis modulator protein 6-like [Notechis scutatus]XP_026546498.1 calcium homeostasis modulator protein 6-like [Notechis scutatus]
MEKFRPVLDFIVNHQKVLGYGVVSLLTAGSERIFSVVVFKCPCNSWNTLYGGIFLLMPAFILFLLGLLLSVRSWKVLTGCCSKGRPCRCPRGNRLQRHLQVMGLAILSAAVAPLTWVSVALLGGSFYECTATGSPILQKYVCKGRREEECLKILVKVPCLSPVSPSSELEIQATLRAQSQVFGWILIASVFTVALLTTCIARCRSPVSVLQLAFWKVYLQKEQELFETMAKEHASKLAERNLKSFFDSTELGPFHTPSAKAWDNISSLFAFNPKDNCYSMIHKYVSQKSQSGSIKSAEGDIYPSCLQFVDGANVEVQIL